MSNSERQLILASASPRRKELLSLLGLSFQIVPGNVDESPQHEERPDHLVERLAIAKARAVSEVRSEAVVLAADTTVALKNVAAEDSTSSGSSHVILNKPENRFEAFQMLQSLSGRSHSVFTGFAIALASQNFLVSQVVETEVEFATLTAEEIEHYLDTGEAFDKAGAYGIQGTAGIFIRAIRGSYSNVVGLPMHEVYQEFVRAKFWDRISFNLDPKSLGV